MTGKCYSCGKVSRGNMPTATIDGKERMYCADCYWKLEKEYKQKKNCEECAYLGKDRCKKTYAPLVPVTIGFNTYFTQADKCSNFSTNKEIILEETKKLETEGQYEEAVLEYEKLGMPEKAEEARKKIKQTTEPQTDINTQIKNLAKKGKTLTYYCCHCGTPLKIGAKSLQIQKTCPSCRGDLELINLSKLIKQHS